MGQVCTTAMMHFKEKSCICMKVNTWKHISESMHNNFSEIIIATDTTIVQRTFSLSLLHAHTHTHNHTAPPNTPPHTHAHNPTHTIPHTHHTHEHTHTHTRTHTHTHTTHMRKHTLHPHSSQTH